jgi:hypothetical protein
MQALAGTDDKPRTGIMAMSHRVRFIMARSPSLGVLFITPPDHFGFDHISHGLRQIF